MKEGSHKKNSKSKKGSERSPLLVQQKKSKVDSERKDMKQSTMFSENNINLICCIIIKMPAFRVDKFSSGRTKCRSPMLKRTWWNSLALFLIGNLQGVLKQ